MKPKIQLTRCSFCVNLSPRQWKALDAKDKNGDPVHEVATGYETPEIMKLYKAGCDELEWNGHFGMNFFFSCDAKDLAKAKAAAVRFIELIDKEKK